MREISITEARKDIYNLIKTVKEPITIKNKNGGDAVLLSKDDWNLLQETLVVSLSDSQKKLISEYAKIQGKTMPDFMVETALDAIEDAIDLRDWEEAKEEFDKDPVTYSHDEIMKEFGLRK